MAERRTRGSDTTIGDEKVREATGRGRDEWFGLLDADGAADWKHGAIAARLVDGYGVDPWWAQSVTVAYEQARGLRRPGQRADGTFEFSVTRSVELPLRAALDALVAAVTVELGTPPVSRSGAGVKHPTARWSLDEGTLLASASTVAPGRTSIGLTRAGLADDAGIPDAKARLRALLASAV